MDAASERRVPVHHLPRPSSASHRLLLLVFFLSPSVSPHPSSRIQAAACIDDRRNAPANTLTHTHTAVAAAVKLVTRQRTGYCGSADALAPSVAACAVAATHSPATLLLHLAEASAPTPVASSFSSLLFFHSSLLFRVLLLFLLLPSLPSPVITRLTHDHTFHDSHTHTQGGSEGEEAREGAHEGGFRSQGRRGCTRCLTGKAGYPAVFVIISMIVFSSSPREVERETRTHTQREVNRLERKRDNQMCVPIGDVRCTSCSPSLAQLLRRRWCSSCGKERAREQGKERGMWKERQESGREVDEAGSLDLSMHTQHPRFACLMA